MNDLCVEKGDQGFIKTANALFDTCLRDLFDLADGWRPVSLEFKKGGTEIKGAVMPDRVVGRKAGSRDWAKRDKKTERTVYLTDRAKAAWMAAWEARTGTCSACVGSGLKWMGWNRTDGDRFAVCPCCNGSGKVAKGEDS